MNAKAPLLLIVILGILGLPVVAATRSPSARAELSWALRSMIHPAETEGVRLQK